MDPFERFGSLLTSPGNIDAVDWPGILTELRATPIGRIEALDAWLVTTHAACSATLLDEALTPDESFSGRYRAPSPDPVLDPVREKNFFTMNRADHRRVRAIAARAFTPTAVERLRFEIQDVVAETLSRLDPNDFDIASEVANVIPPAVIERILNIPECRRNTFVCYADAVVAGIRPDIGGSHDAMDAPLRQGVAAVSQLISERRDHPGEDLLSSLIQAAEGGDRLDDDELVAIVGAIIVGGTETTRSMIGIGTMRLIQNSDQLTLLHTRPELWPQAITEILRHDWLGPALPRYCQTATSICGTPISPGDVVLACIPAANRDPLVFDDADHFRIDRPSQRLLAFGYGAHYCLGSHLATTQLQLSLRMLTQLGDLQLASAPQYESKAGPTRLSSLRLRAA